MMPDRRRCWPAALLCVMWSVAALAQPATENPILTLDRYHPLLPNTTGHPMVKVFGSGRVEIMRPAGFIDPGLHVLQLGPEERDALVAKLRDAQNVPGLLSSLQFDDSAPQSDDGELVYRSDATVSTIKLAAAQPSNDYSRRSGYDDGSAAAAKLQTINMQSISELPDEAVPGVGSLRNIEQSMLELFSRAGDKP